MSIGAATSAVASATTCLEPHDVWTLSLETTNIEGDGVPQLQDYAWPAQLELSSYYEPTLSGDQFHLALEPAP